MTMRRGIKAIIIETLSMVAALIVTGLLLVCCKPAEVHVRWHEDSLAFVAPGVYARVKPVQGRYAMVYNAGDAALVRFSDDNCTTWGEPRAVAEADGYTFTNCELLQLADGRLLYMWNARPHPGMGLPYKIMYAVSDDGGNGWSVPRDLYTAGSDFRNGCWEPVALQLPDGEVHIYFANEAPYIHSDEQEITLMRSYDGCRTWTEPERVSFRKGFRDGMPVPLYLPRSKEVVLAIEDNGICGRFKPVSVRTSDNWRDGCVTADDSRRESALAVDCALPDSVYAGAPYLIGAGKRHTLLSVQSTEGRRGINERYANIRVYVGDGDARNFRNSSAPLPALPPDANALWNSISLLDGDTVIAVMSINGMGKGRNGIWTIKGSIEPVRD